MYRKNTEKDETNQGLGTLGKTAQVVDSFLWIGDIFYSPLLRHNGKSKKTAACPDKGEKQDSCRKSIGHWICHGKP